MTGARLTTRVGLDIIRQGLYILHSCRSLGVEVWGRKVRGKHTVAGQPGGGRRGKGETRERQDLASPLCLLFDHILYTEPSVPQQLQQSNQKPSPAQSGPPSNTHPYNPCPPSPVSVPLDPWRMQPQPQRLQPADRCFHMGKRRRKKENVQLASSRQVQTDFQDVGSQKCL